VRRGHFDLLGPICPGCHARGVSSPLGLNIVEDERDGDILAGILGCSGCGAEYPIVDGLPIIVPDVRRYVQDMPILAKPGFTFDSPTSLWQVRASDLASGKSIQQGGSAKLAVRLNDTTTLTSLTAGRKSDTRFFIDPDATELSVATTLAFIRTSIPAARSRSG
jgi:uncharacterized protein YbaR (Trm112 family)